MEFNEPIFDMNRKDYIRREDMDAEKFKVLRMNASVARSVNAALERSNDKQINKLIKFTQKN